MLGPVGLILIHESCNERESYWLTAVRPKTIPHLDKLECYSALLYLFSFSGWTLDYLVWACKVEPNTWTDNLSIPLNEVFIATLMERDGSMIPLSHQVLPNI